MNTYLLIITGIVGAVSTFYVHIQLKQGAVRASALLSLVVGIFFKLFPEVLNETLTQQIPVVFIGASFIGMVSDKVLNNYYLIALSGIIFTVIFLNTSSFFNGYGGTLGTSACISLLTVMSLPILFSKHRWGNGIASLRKKLFGINDENTPIK
ncbi:hypothetical protein SAMN05216480_1194 [Pustulibacterium marinum]|uniref:Uncharacterized protein n=1 Tax=Pustulibacterium marinum TaxID=1224947 RepID=A0A1I7IPH4_9FLAO|nr:hypothetical protein [Pustulibacterium marinum]SFU74839.1 hypothetical protein SAMN05216480_1194 [Pustulibacterium marinum]